MKKLRFRIFIPLFILLFNACKNPCKDVTCNNGGTCQDGVCECPAGFTGANCETTDPCHLANCGANQHCVAGVCVCNEGYEGTQCQTRSTSKFVGNYEVTQSCGISGPRTYNVSISAPGPGVLSLSFQNLWNFIGDITATLSTNGVDFTIPEQSDSTTFGTWMTVSGGGTRATNGEIDLNFDAGGDVCFANMVPL